MLGWMIDTPIHTNNSKSSINDRNTMGSQNVPGMVVLHCNGRTQGNANLITFKVGTLCTDTCSIDPATVWSTGGRLLFESSGVRPPHYFMYSIAAKRVPLRPIFRVGNSRKSLGARSGEYGGWVMTTRDVWLGTLSWCRNHCPCLPLVAPLPLQNLHVEMTSNTLPRRYELTVHQTVHVGEFMDLFECPRTVSRHPVAHQFTGCHSVVCVKIVKLSVQQAAESYRVVRCRGSHIV
jgi:hypothetical protein